MTVSAASLRKLTTLGLNAEQMAGVLDLLADQMQADEDRRAKQRARTSKSRGNERDSNVTVTSDEALQQRDEVCDHAEQGGEPVSLSPVPLLSPHTPLITPLPPNPSQKQNSRGTRLPDDWQLTGPDLAYALSKGLTEREAGELGERFSAWAWSASGPNAVKKNWHQAYRGWVQREAAAIIKARAGPSAKPLTAFQQRRSETQDILNGLDNFARSGGLSSEKDTRLLGYDPGQRSTAVRDGPCEDADDFSLAGDRARN